MHGEPILLADILKLQPSLISWNPSIPLIHPCSQGDHFLPNDNETNNFVLDLRQHDAYLI